MNQRGERINKLLICDFSRKEVSLKRQITGIENQKSTKHSPKGIVVPFWLMVEVHDTFENGDLMRIGQ